MTSQRDETPSVWISRIRLNDFRNYETLNLDTDRRHVVLTGNNGSGKTNLLEAVSFLSPGRGLRRVRYADVSRQTQAGDQANWAVNIVLDGPDHDVTIGTGLQGEGGESQRRIHIDRQPAKRSEDLLDHARVVWLTPAMDGLFTGPAADRRRFLDRMVLAIDPQHGRRVNAYERAMRSRNRLLEEGIRDPSWLDGIEAQLAESGVAISYARNELVSLLGGLIEAQDEATSSLFARAHLYLEGDLEALSGQGSSADMEDIYKAQLVRDRGRDAAAKRTLTGPHRSNLRVVHAAKKIDADMCSTGEQKALLTGMVLAHAQLVAQVSGLSPILLLDEIAAHLDEHRRAGLFDLVDRIGGQTWMTGTDRSLFDALGPRGQYFTVDNGRVFAGE